MVDAKSGDNVSVPNSSSVTSDEVSYFISANSVMTKSGNVFEENGQTLTKQTDARSFETDLTDKDGESYSFEDFKSNIVSKVVSFLRPAVDQVVLLVGAGGSVVSDNNGEPNAKYGLPMTKILESIIKELGEVSDKSEYLSFEQMKEFADKNETVPSGDLEALLSRFEKAEEFIPDHSRKEYSNTLNKIKQIIVNKTSYDFSEDCMDHLSVINFCNKKVAEGNKLSIVTTNYDTLLEEAANVGHYTIFDGFSFTSSPEFDAKMFDWNLVKDVPNLETKEIIYDKKVVNLLKIHGSLTWTAEDDHRVRRVSKKGNPKPLMIFPSSNKYEQSYRAPYSDLFYKFRELLNRPRTLLVTVGFSFRDTHIFEVVNDAMKHNDGLSVLFTDYSLDSKNNPNLEQLKRRMEEKYQIAFLKATLNGDLSDYLKSDNHD